MKTITWQQRNIPVLFVISNNPDIQELWVSFFGKEYDVFGMVVQDISANLKNQWPDIILLDNPEEFNEINVCSSLRKELSVPMLVLIENYRESRLLELYKAGADDCIVKPISPLVVRAKLRAWSRYTYSSYVTDLDILEIQHWRLVPNSRELYCDSESPVHLTILEYHLMHILMSRANKTVYTDFLVDHLWKKNSSGDTIQLKNLVYRLRRKIEPNPEAPIFLLTIAGIGYSLRLNPKK